MINSSFKDSHCWCLRWISPSSSASAGLKRDTTMLRRLICFHFLSSAQNQKGEQSLKHWFAKIREASVWPSDSIPSFKKLINELLGFSPDCLKCCLGEFWKIIASFLFPVVCSLLLWWLKPNVWGKQFVHQSLTLFSHSICKTPELNRLTLVPLQLTAQLKPPCHWWCFHINEFETIRELFKSKVSSLIVYFILFAQSISQVYYAVFTKQVESLINKNKQTNKPVCFI